ncbi:MAG: AIR synthase family protein [Chloroflexi bacterium]|nr:AIR synthase family protein [Chloroflexota bacterium]
MKTLPTGKLPNKLLQKFLNKIKIKDDRVILGPSVGEDVAVIKFGGSKLLMVKTDPVTFATDLIGWYAVNVNANDIATMGVRPRWFLATILLPEGSTEREAENIFDQVLQACNSLDISLVGGHTEITYDLKRPIIVGCMLGEADNHHVIATSGAKPGDDIVLTKGLAIEGISVLGREARQSLLSAGLTGDLIQRAADCLFSPGISVLKEALIAVKTAKVSAMHDPTEGGLSTGLWEIASAARVGIIVDEAKIPVLPECRDICDKLSLNPLGLLASGALIITLPSSETAKLTAALQENSINAAVIGSVVNAAEGLKMLTTKGTRELPLFQRDELARFLSSRDSGISPDAKRHKGRS